MKISKQKIRDILAKIRDMKDDRAFNIITSLEDQTYFKHRAIEAIQCEDYLLACKLLVILLTLGPLAYEERKQLAQEIKKVKKTNADRS